LFIGLVVLITAGSTLVISSRNLGDFLYETHQYSLAQKSYQIHYSVFGDDQSLVGLYNSSIWILDYDMIIRLFPSVKKEMFESDWDYGRVLSEYLIALYYLTSEESIDLFFDEADRLYPTLLENDWIDFFVPFTDVIATGSDETLRKVIRYLEGKLSEFPTPVMQAAAYTQMAVAYKEIGNLKKAEEMMQKADELDPQ
jgi:tetratricopeptide (TPR) repeat protein